MIGSREAGQAEDQDKLKPEAVSVSPSPPAEHGGERHIIYDDSDISDMDPAEMAALQAQYEGLTSLE